MNNPNPFVPKGSLLELQTKRRSRLKLAVFCSLAVGVVGLSAMLIQGCKRDVPAESTETTTSPLETAVTPATSVTDTSAPPITATSSVVTLPVVIPPVVVPPVEMAGGEYVILKGDTLGKIATAHHVTVPALQAANPKAQPTKLKIGDKLVIPAPTTSAVAPAAMAAGIGSGAETYTVKSGDTLTKIATAHGMSVRALAAANNLTADQIGHLKVNQKLKIPTKAAAVAPEPSPMSPPLVAPTPPPSTMPVR
jgi:N-acetylmuramoyl-L-alanine amidase